MSRSVAGVGAYVPRLFLPAAAYEEAWDRSGPRGVDRVAVPDADEDAVTMAAEAATRALAAADLAPAAVAHLAVATTTPPNDEEALAPRLASLVGCDPARTRQFGGGTEAGVAALAATAGAAGGDPDDGTDDGDAAAPALVVVADAPSGAPGSDEAAAAGAGAAAVVLAGEGPPRVADSAESSAAAPGTRFRQRGAETTGSVGVTGYERERYVETVAGAVDRLGVDPGDVDAAALTAPNGRLPHRAAGATGLSSEQIDAGTVVAETGDAGAAGPLLGLASAFDAGAASALAVGYGGGASATAVHVRGGTPPVSAALAGDVELAYPEALRRRGTITGSEPDGGGAYVSVPSWRRTLPQRHRLVAGRCRACGALAFPPEGACRDCGARDGYDEVRLPGRGTVEAATTIGQGGAPPEFVEHQERAGAFGVCVVAFDGPDGDETVSAPAQVAASPAGTPGVGDRVGTVPRRIYEQEGVVRYGFKIRPAAAER
jgi:hydroxymethylglutaryl-CoA synthase